MLKAGWVKSIKVALLAGLIGLLGFSAEAKDVYYVSGYFGVPGKDAASFTVKDADGNSATYETGDTVIIGKYATVTEAWVSDDTWLPPLIKIEKDFTFHSGVTGEVLSGITVKIAENCTLTLNQGKSANVIKVGTVVFEGDGTVDLSGAASISDPLTLSAGTKFKLPANYTGGIVIADPEKINPDDYPDYVIYVDADGKTQLMPKAAVVAYVGTIPYRTLQSAFDAAKPSGAIVMSAWPTTNLPDGIKDSAQWQGTVTFSGTMPNGFAPANYGNANSTIEFMGVSGGYLSNTNLSFDGALKLTNDGSTPAWTAQVGYSDVKYAFSFGSLTGSGDFVDNGGANQQYSFGDASDFSGHVTVLTKRFVIGSDKHASHSRIYIAKDRIAHIANGKKWDGQWAVRIDGTIIGSGTLASAKQKQIYFGYEPNVGAINDAKPTIDLSEGAPTVDSSCGVTFGSTLTLKNVKPGDTILKCASAPTNMGTVTLKDENGTTQSLWSLKFEDGAVKLSGGIKKLSGNESWTVDAATAADFPTPLILDLTDYYGEGGGKPVGETAHMVITFPEGTKASTYLSKIQVVYPTLHAAGVLSAEGNKIFFTFGHLDLYWNAWRGTFWEAVFGGDINGNNGFGRTEECAEQAILAGDTIVFDKKHYQVAGEFAEQSPYWHYDENLYIKDEVNPGTNNDWDLKILEGVTLKMGLRGAKTKGQNIIRDFKIYVEGGSTLELGYWGNTHHYQGVIRPDVTFGGAGTITLGDDMGASCRIEGNLKVKQDPSAQETEVPTLNVRGKELVVQGGQIDVNLTGFGALSGSGTITTPITFNNATISATSSPGFTFKNEATFTGTLTVDMTSGPRDGELIKICTKGEGGSFVFDEGIDVLVRVNGAVQPAFYTLATDNDGNLCVKVAPTLIEYGATVCLGYDYKTMICRVTMTPAIEGVVAVVTVNGVDENLKTWTAPVIGMRGSGRCEVMVGDADDNFAPGTYSMTVSVGGWTSDELPFTLAPSNDGNLAMVDGFGYKTMREAVAASQESGKGIDLLTNVFFAAPEGTYAIDRNGFDVKATNYTTIDAQTNEVTAEDEVVLTRDGKGITRVVIAGDWLAAGLPWRTKKTIDAAIWTTGATMAPFEAYVLGFDSEDALTAKVIARGVQTADPKTIELTDDLSIKSAAETGVVVTKKLVDANDGKTVVSETTTYDLTQMTNKSALLKLSYAFAQDEGQE